MIVTFYNKMITYQYKKCYQNETILLYDTAEHLFPNTLTTSFCHSSIIYCY